MSDFYSNSTPSDFIKPRTLSETLNRYDSLKPMPMPSRPSLMRSSSSTKGGGGGSRRGRYRNNEQRRQWRTPRKNDKRSTTSTASTVAEAVNPYQNWNRRRFRCCFGCMHIKTGAFVIGILDVFWISAAFGRGIHLFLTVKDNPMAVSWFVVSTLMAILGSFAILAMFYGMWKEKYLWIIPKLVVTLFSVLLLLVMTFVLIYLIFDHSQSIIDLVAEQLTSSDYEQARFAVKIGGTTLIILCLLLALIQSWFYLLLYRCFKFFKRRYVWLNVQAKLAMERKANDFGGSGKFDQDSFLKAWCEGRHKRKRNGEIVADHAHLSVPDIYRGFDRMQSCSDV